MNLLQQSRQAISDRLFIAALARHRCRMGWRDAPRYTRHWQACRKAMGDPLPPAGDLAPAIAAFARDGVSSFHTPETGAIASAISERLAAREAAGEAVWQDDPDEIGNNRYAGDTWRDFPELESLFRGPLGTFLEHHFGCHFRISFALLYRNSPKKESRVGSQRWHSDSGPGSCVNVMFYLDATAPENGPLEALPWPQALEIFRGERAALRAQGGPRETGGDRNGALYDHYGRLIEERYASRIVQRPGRRDWSCPSSTTPSTAAAFPWPAIAAPPWSSTVIPVTGRRRSTAIAGTASPSAVRIPKTLKKGSEMNPLSLLKMAARVLLRPVHPNRPAHPLRELVRGPRLFGMSSLLLQMRDLSRVREPFRKVVESVESFVILCVASGFLEDARCGLPIIAARPTAAAFVTRAI